jgi:SAM-dependent methyltransferase
VVEHGDDYATSGRMSRVASYGDDLAAIHAAGFTELAEPAGRELLARLDRPSLIVDLGCGDGTTAAVLTAAGHDVLGIDSSPAQIELARRRAPGATFRLGSFVDADLPGGCDAIVAVGEVLGYAVDARNDAGALDAVLARAAAALRARGLLLFDLAGPGRVPASGRHAWTAGDGWAVLAESRPRPGAIERRIVTFRDPGDGRVRRTEELHRLLLHRPADVLARVRAAGFRARVLAPGYGGEPLPPGLTAYVAHRR